MQEVEWLGLQNEPAICCMEIEFLDPATKQEEC
jgi:hypothetical protein